MSNTSVTYHGNSTYYGNSTYCDPNDPSCPYSTSYSSAEYDVDLEERGYVLKLALPFLLTFALLVAARLPVRFLAYGRLFVDDAAMVAAFVCAAIFLSEAVKTGELTPYYVNEFYFEGFESPDEYPLYTVDRYAILPFLTAFFLKIAFIFLFRRLFGDFLKFRRWWWALTVLSIVDFIAAVVHVALGRHPKAASYETQAVFFYCIFSVDMITFAAIIYIPFAILRAVQFRRSFSIGWQVMAYIAVGVWIIRLCGAIVLPYPIVVDLSLLGIMACVLSLYPVLNKSQRAEMKARLKRTSIRSMTKSLGSKLSRTASKESYRHSPTSGIELVSGSARGQYRSVLFTDEELHDAGGKNGEYRPVK